jgi:hypothetical protein
MGIFSFYHKSVTFPLFCGPACIAFALFSLSWRLTLLNKHLHELKQPQFVSSHLISFACTLEPGTAVEYTTSA